MPAMQLRTTAVTAVLLLAGAGFALAQTGSGNMNRAPSSKSLDAGGESSTGGSGAGAATSAPSDRPVGSSDSLNPGANTGRRSGMRTGASPGATGPGRDDPSIGRSPSQGAPPPDKN